MANLTIADSIKTAKPGVLLDSRGVVDNTYNVYDIQNPAVGCVVYAKEDKKLCVITEVQEKAIDANISIAGGSVKSYITLPSQEDIQELQELIGSLDTIADEILAKINN